MYYISFVKYVNISSKKYVLIAGAKHLSSLGTIGFRLLLEISLQCVQNLRLNHAYIYFSTECLLKL